MTRRTLFGVCGLALLGLFTLGVPPLLHPATTASVSSTTTSDVNMTSFNGTNASIWAANQSVSSAVTGLDVSYSGLFYSGFINPGCATEPHECAMPAFEFFYLISGSSAYRLIPLSSPFMFADGTRVMVTGILVTPSSFGSVVWQGYTFTGDIYVQSISPT